MSKEKANEKINSQISSSGEKNTKNKIIIAIIVIILCVLVGVILYLVLGKDAEPESEQEPKEWNMVVTPDNVDEILAQLKDSDKTPMGSYEVRMVPDWEFDNGDAVSSNAYVENVVNNQNTVYFDITRTDDSSVIYKSPYLPVGRSLEKIKLDTSLPAGVYDTVLTYHLVDEKNQELSTVSVALTITIKN